jgi:hypothetical protein
MEDALAIMAKPVPEIKAADESVIILERSTVVESYNYRQLETAIDRDGRRQKEEQFSIIKGGTIYTGSRLEIGGWMEGDDWVFMRLRRRINGDRRRRIALTRG